MRHVDPAQCIPDERFREVARLLAIGLRRLHLSSQKAAYADLGHNFSKSPEILSSSLELPAQTRLTGHTG